MENPNDEIISQLCGYMRVGAGYMLAATACGVQESTAHAWIKKARKAKDGIYRQFYEAVRIARAQAEVIALQRLAAEGGSSGAKTVLEIINPAKYGKQAKKAEDPLDSGEIDFDEWFDIE